MRASRACARLCGRDARAPRVRKPAPASLYAILFWFRAVRLFADFVGSRFLRNHEGQNLRGRLPVRRRALTGFRSENRFWLISQFAEIRC